jgi:adenosine deaminase/aminodeoxyfutalosine deaminase
MTSAFIHSLPKAELHLHLEGSVTAETLVELRKRNGKQSTLAQTESLYQYRDFNGFLMAFKTLTEDLQTPEDYELITYRLMEQLKAENVLHAEVYVSVGVCLWRKQDFDAIFEGLERGRQRGERDFGVSLLWIFDAVRQFGPGAAREVFGVAAKYRDRNVVGVGIGGDEVKRRRSSFAEPYAHAARPGAAAHGARPGETAGPESVWGALNLGAEPDWAWADGCSGIPELIEELATRRIPVEICLTSNLRTGCLSEILRAPLRIFDQGLMLTLNSDDPAMFGTTLTREYELAQASLGLPTSICGSCAGIRLRRRSLPAERKCCFEFVGFGAGAGLGVIPEWFV